MHSTISELTNVRLVQFVALSNSVIFICNLNTGKDQLASQRNVWLNTKLKQATVT